MKMGIKEFRERLSEIVRGEEPVEVTHHGRIVGRFVPVRVHTAPEIDMAEWVRQQEQRRDEWRARTPNWRELLVGAGIDPDHD